MIGDPGGIGKSTPNPTEGINPSMGPESSKGGTSEAQHSKGPTMDDLKRTLVEHFGEKDGKKMYNTILNAFAMSALAGMRSAAKGAAKAAKSMGGDSG